MAEHFRTVVREHLFEDSLRDLISDEADADEFIAAAEFVLSADPKAGLPIAADSPVWALKMPPSENKDVTLYYTFDEETVSLLFIGRD